VLESDLVEGDSQRGSALQLHGQMLVVDLDVFDEFVEQGASFGSVAWGQRSAMRMSSSAWSSSSKRASSSKDCTASAPTVSAS
jgi:hypothetical protein